MPTDYLPTREADLALWTANFANLATASPTLYGFTSAQATQYATLDTVWQNALAAASDPSTRTSSAVAAKDVAKVNVKAYSRQLAAVAQAYPSITPDLLSDLGLTVRDTGRTPTPPPNTYPLVDILSTASHACIIALNDQNTPNARRRPDGVIGAQLYVAFGASPPTGIDQMTYLGLQTRYPQSWDVGVANVGKMAWFIARWTNRKGQTGPISTAASTIVA
jgi:hypothetical protein